MREQEATKPTAPIGIWAVHPAVWLCGLWAILLIALRTARPGLEIGHGWIDANILNAMSFFDRLGYGPTKGLPTVQTALGLDGRPDIYSTYPPGPYWGCEVLRRIGLDELWHLRIATILVSIASVYLLCRIVERLTRSRSLGLLVGVFYACSVPFVTFSSSLNLVSWGQLTLFLAILAWLHAEVAETRAQRIRRTILAFCALALDAYMALEHIPFMGVFIGVRVLLLRRWPVFFSAAAALTAPVVAMGVRLAHNAWALGGFDRALAVLVAKGKQRTGLAAGPDFNEIASNWLIRLGMPRIDAGSLGSLLLPAPEFNRTWSYPALSVLVALPALAILTLVLFGRSASSRTLRRGLLVGGLFLLGCAPWFILMSEHTGRHLYLIIFVMPGLAIVLGGIAWAALATDAGRIRAWTLRGLAVVMLAGLALDLRRADLFNAFVKLDPHTAGIVHSGAEAYATMPLMSEHTPEDLTFIVYPRSPETGTHLPRPFIHANSQPKLPLPEGYALCLDPWFPPDRMYTADAVRAHGQPRIFTPPPSKMMIFRAAQSFRPNARVLFAENLSITDLRFRETADGLSWSIGWVIEGQLSAQLANRYVFRAVFPTGRTDRRVYPTRLSWNRFFDDSLGLVWSVLGRDAFQPGDPVRLEIWDTQERVRVALDAQQLPAGATLTPGGFGILWNPRAVSDP